MSSRIPPSSPKDVDHLDMMAHLYGQMKALTAVAWGAPGKVLHVRFLLTDDDRTTRPYYAFRMPHDRLGLGPDQRPAMLYQP